MSVDWNIVADRLDAFAADSPDELLDQGQKATVGLLAQRIRAGNKAVLLADEVGMGKTRIAVALIEAVRAADGRSVIVVPGGLGAQWQAELRQFKADDATLLPLRSYESFIEGFSQESDWQKPKQKSQLAARKLQRDLPEKSWADEKVLIISHSFANMRFPRKAEGPHLGWRRELLPAVLRNLENRRRNQKKRDNAQGVTATHRAARAIAEAIRTNNLNPDLSGDHRRLPGDVYRDRVSPLIGYGLGRFDLMIIDEAHKSRGENSSLSRILGPVTWESDKPFRLGMTATPVELDADQWIDTLSRINGGNNKVDTPDAETLPDLETLRDTVKTYTNVAARLQVEALDDELASTFEASAKAFKTALDPHVLRRDKRDDSEYRRYFDSHGDYRNVDDISISPETHADCFTRDWLRRFCAAEALSLLPQENPRIKRLRLSVAQGHSLDAVANHLISEKIRDEEAEIADNVGVDAGSEERSTTAGFWLDALGQSAPDIYDHPALLAVTSKIESFTARGDKVLVFGRYIKPLRALTRYLDTRAMLRALMAGDNWPGQTINPDSEPAVEAALRDPVFARHFGDIQKVRRLLAEQYNKRENLRRDELRQVRAEIDALATSDEYAALLAQLLGQEDAEGKRRFDNAHLFEALAARRASTLEKWSGASLVVAFKSLCADLVRDDETDQPSAKTLLDRLSIYLENYSGLQGSFARLMFGETGAQTRRNLQGSFNRKNANPRVLLAQSRVGREGLNLHEECRRVVLLHAEWNPAIVEQQIGRVDRKNSRWLKDYRAGVTDEGAVARIHIHPVVMRGTYDDHNWQVLKSRWRDLRAQLHGEVLPRSQQKAVTDPEQQSLIDRVVAATPNFSPLRSRKN